MAKKLAVLERVLHDSFHVFNAFRQVADENDCENQLLMFKQDFGICSVVGFASHTYGV